MPPTTSAAVIDHLKIDKAHIVGLSMGGFATLHFGFRHPAGAVAGVAGCGYGAEPAQQREVSCRGGSIAKFGDGEGMAAFAEKYAYGPTRVQFENKDPRGFAEFKASWPSIRRWARPTPRSACSASAPRSSTWWTSCPLTFPTLVLTGDEDWPCLPPGILMKREFRSAALR